MSAPELLIRAERDMAMAKARMLETALRDLMDGIRERCVMDGHGGRVPDRDAMGRAFHRAVAVLVCRNCGDQSRREAEAANEVVVRALDYRAAFERVDRLRETHQPTDIGLAMRAQVVARDALFEAVDALAATAGQAAA